MAEEKAAVPRTKAYQLVEVEKTEPPAGIEGGSWYRYVIALGGEKIVGNRRGTLKQVTEYAHECAENISSRAGRGTSTWSPRKKK